MSCGSAPRRYIAISLVPVRQLACAVNRPSSLRNAPDEADLGWESVLVFRALLEARMDSTCWCEYLLVALGPRHPETRQSRSSGGSSDQGRLGQNINAEINPPCPVTLLASNPKIAGALRPKAGFSEFRSGRRSKDSLMSGEDALRVFSRVGLG